VKAGEARRTKKIGKSHKNDYVAGYKGQGKVGDTLLYMMTMKRLETSDLHKEVMIIRLLLVVEMM